jgi:hypothetical protein
MADLKETFFHPVVPMDFQYNYRVGPYIQRYLDGFKEKKITGVKCPSCGKVYVPPRMFCSPCNRKLDEFVEVSQEGTVENFCVGHVTLEKGQLKEAEDPYVLAMVKLEGTDDLLLARLGGLSPSEVKKGLKVRAVWKDEVEGDYFDLSHFEAV